MLNLEQGIDSLTNFKRQTAEYLDRLHQTGDPVVLTVNGKAQVVVQDAAAYQKLVEAATRAEREETIAAIKEAKKYGISTSEKSPAKKSSPQKSQVGKTRQRKSA